MSDLYLVTNYYFNDFIPDLLVGFILGLIIIGFVTRFARNI